MSNVTGADHFFHKTGLRVIATALSLIISSQSFPATTDDRIEDVRTQIVALSQALHDGERPTHESVKLLGTSLSLVLGTPTDQLPLELKGDSNFTKRLLALHSLMGRFEQLYSANLGADTLQSAVNDVRHSFLNAFAAYFYATEMKSKMKKVILFSTSVSCECTLKMCEEQELALYALQSSHPGELTVIVVDAFHQYELQKKHDVMFLPTAIVLDETNKEIARLEREERFHEKLKSVIDQKRSNTDG